MLRLGNKSISKLYFGDKAISKAYLGSKLVFQSGKPIFLDYIESTGTQMIVTGITAKVGNSGTWTVTAQSTVTNKLRMLLAKGGTDINFFGYNDTGKWGFGASIYFDISADTKITAKVVFEETQVTAVIGNETLVRTGAGNTNPFILGGFSTSATGNYNFVGRIFGCSYEDVNGNLLLDLRPCIDPKGTVCMYDMVTRKYFYTAGDGEFIAGKFRFIDYIKSTGVQYIDTGIKGTDVTRFVVKGTCVENGVNNTQLLGGNNSSSQTFFGNRYSNSVAHWYCMDSKNTSIGNPHNLSIIDATIESDTSQYGTLTDLVDGTVSEFIKFSGNAWAFQDTNLLLFGGNSTRRSTNATCYMLQLYTKDGLVRDFVPALDADGVACMYDKVTCKYFYNAGEGSFIAGGRFVESLESTGTEYIDTGFNLDACRVEIVAECTSLPATSGYQALFSKNYDYAGCAVFACNPNWGVRSYIQTNTPSNKKSTIIANFSLENSFPKAVMTVDGVSVEYTRTSLPSSANHNWSLMGTPNRSFGLKGRVYSCKIYDSDNNLLADYKPYLDESGVACMKDMVTGAILHNSGTGTFGFTE